jgi:hypothetical protein
MDKFNASMIPCKRHFLTIIFIFFEKEILDYYFMTKTFGIVRFINNFQIKKHLLEGTLVSKLVLNI